MGLRTCAWLLVSAAPLAWSLGVLERHATITAPPALVKRDDPIGTRTDFVGYYLGDDQTWTPEYCLGGSITSTASVFYCCWGDCTQPVACAGASIVEIATNTASQSSTRTVKCGGLGPIVCQSGLVLQSMGDQNTFTSYYCGLDPIVNNRGVQTYFRTLPANSPVSTTIPTESNTVNTKVSSSSTLSTRQTSSTTSANSDSTTTTPPPGQSNSDSSKNSASLNQGDKIGIGIGVGLGVPLVLLAALAWLCPHPLQRFKSKPKPVVTTEVLKPELSAQESMVSPINRQELQNTEGNRVIASAQEPTEIHGQPRAELYS